MALTLNSFSGGGASGSASGVAPARRYDGEVQPFSIALKRAAAASSSSASFLRPQLPFSSHLSFSSRTSPVVGASNRFSSRSGKLQKKDRRSSSSATTIPEEQQETGGRSIEKRESETKKDSGAEVKSLDDAGFVTPDLPGQKPDFWEGSKWDALGFFVQYLWAFGIVFALVACGIAVATYNEGATDFKDTSAYKESVQSKELLEGPEVSDSDVFESNPTEEAPSLD